MQIVACTTQHVSLQVKLHWSPRRPGSQGDTITQMIPQDITKTKIALAIWVAYATLNPRATEHAYLPKSNANRGMYNPTCGIACETALEDGLVLHRQGTP